MSLRLLLIATLMLTAIHSVQAATIHGTIYSWETLEPLPKSIVTINTTPEQRFISDDGSYFLSLSPGSYVLKAFYYKQGTLYLYTEENITIDREGDYILDLILFPPLSELSKLEEFEDIEFPLLEERKDYSLIFIMLAILVIVAAVYMGRRYRRYRHYKREKYEPTSNALPDDLKEVVDILRKEGGRITQKDLRKKLGYSEAKMSLIIADLERRGLVEKIKKGRGNLIFLKEPDEASEV
jgi:uncharacterized membrane protein